jgi:hypothetical protein
MWELEDKDPLMSRTLKDANKEKNLSDMET